MLGFMVGLAAFAAGGAGIYALIFLLELLSKLVTPGGQGAKFMALAFICGLMLIFCKPVGDGILAERKRR